VVTDESWRSDPDPPMRSSDILDGESYDARKEAVGWDVPGFADLAWKAWQPMPRSRRGAVAQPNEPIRPVLERKPVALTEPAKVSTSSTWGRTWWAGRAFSLKGTRGTAVTVRYGEALSDDGTLYTENLRGAAETDVYTLRGSGRRDIRTALHVSRISLRGGDRRAPAAHVDGPGGAGDLFLGARGGEVSNSNDLLNRLMSNVLWRSAPTCTSVPTDCPQRDERLGWMGDIQTFSQVAIFNMDMAAFFTKWVRDIRDDQTAEGQFPDYAPNPGVTAVPPHQVGAPAWGDAA